MYVITVFITKKRTVKALFCGFSRKFCDVYAPSHDLCIHFIRWNYATTAYKRKNKLSQTKTC